MSVLACASFALLVGISGFFFGVAATLLYQWTKML